MKESLVKLFHIGLTLAAIGVFIFGFIWGMLQELKTYVMQILGG